MHRTQGKPGRKPKGNRVKVSAAFPAEAIALVDDIALRNGQERTAVLGRLLCEHLGLPVPAYCLPTTTDQQELPLSKAS